MATKTAFDLANLSILYKTGRIPTSVASSSSPLAGKPRATPSKYLNDRITLHRGDITMLAVDAIVNAANEFLMGGGGVDGAIHRAAGPGLLQECMSLGGCPTGSAKITDAYELPCKRVIHAVGPIYHHRNSEGSEADLTGCYRTSLELAVKHGLETIAFSAISTGVYGYPSRDAASVAAKTVRDFLEGPNGHKIRLVVFVVFEKKDLVAYHEALPHHFPPVPEGGAAQPDKKTKDEEAQREAREEAEAEVIASELPDVPTTDPDAGEHVAKKQK